MNIRKILVGLLSVISVCLGEKTNEKICEEKVRNNKCVSFSVGSGTGCAWMCEYCQNQLGTTNYYFTDGVCTYQSGGCVGNPQVGKTYTCCSV